MKSGWSSSWLAGGILLACGWGGEDAGASPGDADGAAAFCRAASEAGARCNGSGGECGLDQATCRADFSAAFRDEVLYQLASCVEGACTEGPARVDVASCEIAVEPTARQRAVMADVCALCPEHTVSGESCAQRLLPSIRSSLRVATCAPGVALLPDAVAEEVGRCVRDRVSELGPDSCSYAISTCTLPRTPTFVCPGSTAAGGLWIDYCD